MIWFRRGYAVLVVLVGAALAVSGAYLLSLGGSFYYLIAGLVTAASGVALWRADRRAPAIYGAMLLGTIAWAIWEAGFDGWALVPRIVGPVVFGIGFLFFLRSPAKAGAPARSGRAPVRCLAIAIGSLVAAIVVGAIAHAIGPADYPDPLYQTGMVDAVPAALTTPALPGVPRGEWHNYGNDAGGSRFSDLDQLTPQNAGKLRPAWEIHVGRPPMGGTNSLETTPLKIGDSLYLCTGYNDVLSVDAETGHVNWRFHSNVDVRNSAHGTCRGVAYFHIPGGSGFCADRIITNTIDARLIAFDAPTGRMCPDFGVNGQVDLLKGMGHPDFGYYYTSSAPTIVRGKIVLGGWVMDGQYWGEPSGVIRAFDAVTGKFAWAFDVGRPTDHAEPPPGKSYTPSTPNSWAPMSADETLGLVYAPTGNAAPDYYGRQRRPFDDKYSSAVVAIDVETGNVRWVFQTTHHDLWDYDVASQPTLVDIPGGAGPVEALVQPTKRGEIFLLDRTTGRPIANVVERPAPQAGGAPGERLAPTQPFSVGMPSFGGPRWRERDMWGLTPFDQLWCRAAFRKARYDGTMTPPGTTYSISYPGYLGGVDWGSASVDKDLGLLIVNSNRVGNYNLLVPRAEADRLGVTPSAKGSPLVSHGMVAQANTPFAAKIRPFLSPLGVPCNEPPYGLISAVDLRTHKLLWSKPLGSAEDSGPRGIRSHLPFAFGLPNAGGSVTTRGGLVFLAATQSPMIRAFDVRTGQEVWRYRLPAGGHATPMTYWSNKSQRQFVVVAAGGNVSLQSPSGDSVIAYALPK